MSHYVQAARTHSRRMVALSASEWPTETEARQPVVGVWHSREYLAVHYRDARGDRLSVNRTTYNMRTGAWRDGIPWDDLQRVKQQCGFGDRWAVEIYPPDADVVNAAAMRHLWLLPEPPTYGWDRDNK